MASVFGHAMLATAISVFSKSKRSILLISVAIFSSIMPDFDVIAFDLGIPYESMWGHRGFTHSIFFAVLWSIFVALVLGRDEKLKWFLIIVLATISHGFLDAMTTGGKGVAFFAPFDASRHFLPEVLRNIRVSPIGAARFFSEYGLKVIKSELVWIGIPSAIIIGIRYLINSFKRKSS